MLIKKVLEFKSSAKKVFKVADALLITNILIDMSQEGEEDAKLSGTLVKTETSVAFIESRHSNHFVFVIVRCLDKQL